MAKHLKLFETTNDYTTAQSKFEFPTVSYVEETSELHYMVDPNGPIKYEYVDLGLSVKWATCNIGARSPEEYGLYFAWGETEGYSDGKSGKEFTWDDYAHGTSSSNLTKYNSDDGKTVLELTDDAAHVNMGDNWRMPTSVECQELIDNTTTAWTTVNGVYGTKFTSTKEGYTDKYIFVPAAGYCYYGSVYNAGSRGYLWSSSLHSYNARYASNLIFVSAQAYVNHYDRCYGYSVRGVLA